MPKPYILLDIDGVCLNWIQGLESYVQAHHPHLAEPEFFDEHAFDLVGRFGISQDEANQLVWDFHHSHGFGELQPLPGALDAIEMLSGLGHLVAITACGTASQIEEHRMHNLQTVFGDCFQQVYCTNTFAEKTQYLRQYPPGYWVEDHLNNALAGVQEGHRAYLVDAPYNRHSSHDQVTRVNSLWDAACVIREQLPTRCQL